LAAKAAIALESCHAVDVLKQAFVRHGIPEFINTDQDSQFTALLFVEAVKSRRCRLSMDGRGSCRDNIFVERFWRTVKYGQVYLHAYDLVSEVR